MTLENLPEMQLLRTFTNQPIDFSKITPRFNGDLLILTMGEELPHQHYIIGQDNQFTSASALHDAFCHLAGRYAGYKTPLTGVTPLFEARMLINQERISIKEMYDKYPGYDEKIIKPIIEKWAKNNLPDHRIDLE